MNRQRKRKPILLLFVFATVVYLASLVVSLPVKAAEHLGEITQDRTISTV